MNGGASQITHHLSCYLVQYHNYITAKGTGMMWSARTFIFVLLSVENSVLCLPCCLPWGSCASSRGRLVCGRHHRTARRFHLPELLIGATVVSIGTTLLEVMVSATSAITSLAKGHGALSLSNVIGANLVQGLVLLLLYAAFCVAQFFMGAV